MSALESTGSPAQDLPRTVGRYELLHELASGGMATVYLGRARSSAAIGPGRFVAIKCCHAHLRREPEFAAMFLDEARLASRIHHPNVVATLDVSEDDAQAPLMVMEFVDGFSLAQIVRAAAAKERAIPVDIALRVTLDALAGLHAAHELKGDDGKLLGLVHRDVSPHNVLVGTDGISRIMDFGIAKAESRLTHTREGTVKGKLGYMAPEQHGLGLPEGTKLPPLTRQADVYSAGIVLWELLAAQRLFHGDTDAKTLKLVLRSIPKKPSQLRPEAPAALDVVVMRALSKPAFLRYRTTDEFARAIEGTGVQPASASAVGAFVSEVLADEVAARRELVARLQKLASASADASQRIGRVPAPESTGARALPPREPVASPAVAAPEPRPVSGPVPTAVAPATPPVDDAIGSVDVIDDVDDAVVVAEEPEASASVVIVPPPKRVDAPAASASIAPRARARKRRGRLFPAAVVGLLLAVAGGALGARLSHRAHPTAAPVAHASLAPHAPVTPPSPPVTPASPPVTPPPAPVVVAPPPVVAAPPPPVVTAPAPLAPSTLPVGAAPAGTVHRPRVPAGTPRHTPYRPTFL